MAKSRNRKGKKYDPRKQARRWLVGFSLVWDRKKDGDGSLKDRAYPCYGGVRSERAEITWAKNYKTIDGDKFRWRLRIYAEFDTGIGDPYTDSALYESEPMRLMDLMGFCDQERDKLFEGGNKKFLVNWGWCAEILPDKAAKKNYRLTMADRLERLIKRESKK